MTVEPSNSETPTLGPAATMDNNDDVAPATKAMRAILGKTIKCTLDDGRTATGTLLCVDRLYVNYEFCRGKEGGRSVGLHVSNLFPHSFSLLVC
jgi:hypothetical protein